MAPLNQQQTQMSRFMTVQSHPRQQNSTSRPILQPLSQISSATATRTAGSVPASVNLVDDASTAEDYATQQVRQRANLILDNHHLLMRYATANSLVSPFEDYWSGPDSIVLLYWLYVTYRERHDQIE
jgi:hypothetical protein